MNATFLQVSSIKLQILKDILKEIAPVAVAFSGGVDSSLLLKVAHDVLGERCVAVTVDLPYQFRKELADADQLAQMLGVRHQIIPALPSAIQPLMSNPPDRCYTCKKMMLEQCLLAIQADTSRLPCAIHYGESATFTLIDGSNLDDRYAHRPGRRAIQELGVRSPLEDAGLGKRDIRELSHKLGLASWNKPAQSCLLTRFPVLYQICIKEMERVEQVETELRLLGLGVVRARSCENIARIEAGDVQKADAMLPEIINICQKAGFRDVEIDHSGYRKMENKPIKST